MPLVRSQVRNEFGLGQPELYKEANREDPKDVLDGVAVAGLVGILRQLGDFADFAAEVFHGLQEQVMTSASRSHKLMVRVKNIEASLPSLEKAVLAQTSHIHFAYTAGCEWHPRIKTARNHFIYNDLPQFIMDSYEECRDPPCLHVLDKFDAGGPGSCLKRYSDPTFFQRVSAYSDEAYSEKFEKARKSRKNKKKRSSWRSGEILRGGKMRSSSGRLQFISPAANGRMSLSPTTSTINMSVKSDMGRHSNSFDSAAGGDYIEGAFHPSDYVQPDKDSKELSSFRLAQKTDIVESVSPVMDDNFSPDSVEKNIASSSSGVTWDEKEEIVESNSQVCDRDKIPEVHEEKEDLDFDESGADILKNINDNDIIFDEESKLNPVSGSVQMDEIDSEPDSYMDALNTIEPESENDLDGETKQVENSLDVTQGSVKDGVVEAASIALDHNLSDSITLTIHSDSLNKELIRSFPDSLQEIPSLMSESHVPSLGSPTPSDVPVNKETIRSFPDSLLEIPPLMSESHVPSLESPTPSDVPVNKETIRSFPDSLQEVPPLMSESHVPSLESPTPSDVPVNKETIKSFPDSLQEVPPLMSESHVPSLESPTPSDFPVNKETIRSFPDSLQEIPNLMSESHVPSLESPTPSDVPVNKETIKSFPDSLQEVPPLMSESHVPSLESPTPSDFPVNKETIRSFLDSLQEIPNLMSESHVPSLESPTPSDVPVNKETIRSFPDSLLEIPPLMSESYVPILESPTPSDVPVNKETIRSFPDSLLEIPPLMSESHVPSLESPTPSDVPVNKETIRSFPDSLLEIPPLMSESHVPSLESPTLSDVLVNKETIRSFPDSLLEIPPLMSESHVPSLEFRIPLDVPLNKEMTKGLADSNGSESNLSEQVPPVCENSVLDSSVGADILVSDHTVDDPASPSSKSDTSSSDSDSSNLPENKAVRTDNDISKCKKTPIDCAGEHPVSFWTNGGLLGLQPSKPPDFTMSSSLSQASLTTKNNVDVDQNSMPSSNGYNEERDLLAKVPQDYGCLTSQHDDQACTEEMTSSCSHMINGFDQTDGDNLHDNRVMASRRVLPVAPDAKASSTVANQGSREISSLVFGLSHSLLMNSLRQKLSSNEKSGPDICSKPGILEQSGQNSILHHSLSATTFKEESDYGYPIDSLPPSPPLEHMKISFHPFSEFETSKLKLKFPDGSNRHESIRDMYPSFQLVPEPSISLCDSGCNTDDDDTFSRSSPYLSDDCPSPHSDNNSDLWEHGETPKSSDFDRTASMESTLNPQELTGATNDDVNVAIQSSICAQNGVESSLSGPLLDLPSFDNVTPLHKQESNRPSDCNNIGKSLSNGDPTPPPPPLPPLQRKFSKPNEMEDYYTPENTQQIDYLNHSESTFSQQPRPAQVKHNHTTHEAREFNDNFTPELKSKQDQKLNGRKEAKQMAIGKEMDERGDFLHQIRTKSFNLRQTVTGTPNGTTSPTKNVKVTAILEKANAIRQVIASDDDTWSDT